MTSQIARVKGSAATHDGRACGPFLLCFTDLAWAREESMRFEVVDEFFRSCFRDAELGLCRLNEVNRGGRRRQAEHPGCQVCGVATPRSAAP